MVNNPYFDEDKNPRFLTSLVFFADILGWSTRSIAAVRAGEGQEFLLRTREAISDAYNYLRERALAQEPGDRDFEVKTFTDNIVIGMPIRLRPDAESELGSMLDLLSIFVAMMTGHGFFLRGAISYGEHFMDDDFVLGPALVEAAREDRSGRPPRIVLTRSVEDLVRTHITYYGNISQAPHYRDLLEDVDGRLLLNYLSAAFLGLPNDAVITDVFERHREHILAGLSDHEDSPAVLGKFVWLAEYQNFVCTEYADSYDLDPSLADGETLARMAEAEVVRGLCIGEQRSSGGVRRMSPEWGSESP